MFKNYFIKVVLSIIFVFFILTCSKKHEINKVYEPENEEIITNENNIITKNEADNNKVYRFRGYDKINHEEFGFGGWFYSDDHVKFIWNLLLEKNKKEVDNVLDNAFHFGGDLKYISMIKVDIDTTESETWFSSWHFPDSTMATYNSIFMHIIKNDNMIKTYRIPIMPSHMNIPPYLEDDEGMQHIKFPILTDILGRFYTGPDDEEPSAWLCDINEDGFDEIICVTYLRSKDYHPQVRLEISGFDKEKDKFVLYLDIKTITIDKETGPEPIQYIQNQGYWGFRCLVDGSKYTPIYGLPATENENFTWVFFVWDSDEKKYIEKIFIEE
jgi:hypothetical protein